MSKTILERVKDKYYEIKNDENEYSTIQERINDIKEFNNRISLEKLKNITLEDYDYPQKIDKEKNKNSLMHFIEHSSIGMSLGGHSYKRFYYDSDEAKNGNVTYLAAKSIMIKSPTSSIEEMFEKYIEEIYNWINNFDEKNYKNDDKVLIGLHVLPIQLIRIYRPNTIFGFANSQYYEMLFNEIDKKNAKSQIKDDILQTNINLKIALADCDPEFKNMYSDMEALSEAIVRVWFEDHPKIVNESLPKQNEEDIKSDILQSNELIDDIIEVLLDKKNVILTGTPGVGKTFSTMNIIKLIELQKNPNVDFNELKNRIEFTQFHQSYGYEEFVEGITLVEHNTKPKDGKFKKLVDDAIKTPEQNFYMIIDEINRGNLSKILGELLMCIEPDKRSIDYGISLLYSNDKAPFYVPENVYIIGTMNTADRSLALVDYALRRRFSFFNLKPAFNTDKFNNKLQGCSILDEINTTLTYINTIIEKYFHSTNFNIGHSYFVSNDIDEKKYKRILKYEIIPLIREYMSDLEDNEIYNKFATENPKCKIFNDLLCDMVKNNEI